MKTTPRAGDYVKTEGMTEYQYHAVAKVFIDAGFGRGEYPNLELFKGHGYFGISLRGKNLFHASITGSGGYYLAGHQLSLSDLLGDDEPAWSGEGLPPVGAECEALNHNGAWVRVKIKAISDKYAILEHDDQETPFLLGHTKFRPLKSEREIAIEELSNLLSESIVNHKKLAEYLYDKGYRRVEK